MIVSVGTGTCLGCGAALTVWFDGLHTVTRDRSLIWSPVHLCDDPELRERVLMDWGDAPTGCQSCGEPDVAYSTWGRWVDFPVSSMWGEGWVGPLNEHVCATDRNSAPQQIIVGVEVPTL